MKLASILDVPGHTGISEYIKDVWEESKYIKPLEITRKFANNNLINVARRVQSTEMKPFHRFVHFMWIGTGENRRRDDALEEEGPAEDVHEEAEEGQTDFDWEVVIDKAAVQGESGSDDQFFDAQVDVEELVTETLGASAFPVSPGDLTIQQKEQTPADPSGPSGHIPEFVINKLQAEFERAKANKIQADLEKAQVENARLLALLQQAQSNPKP
ncbi:hypothetical protein Dimus_030766 [Dionaea muscipula]